ncbi:unnamed protein product [Echinostoma caproni]|uniref:Uncharacterized protein n=1 Tax=Echinostoma caproni TaxID=27848 RepID=A0A3P8H446_9TREM|nr:unnamed protein product [Echinostoma caproni]
MPSPGYGSSFPNQNQVWRVVNVDESLIYGENCVLDVRPGKTEQYFRVLALNEGKNRRVWVDAYRMLRIPPLSELLPTTPTTVTVRAQPTTVPNASSSVEHVIQWTPAEQHNLFAPRRGSGNEHESNWSDLHYRVEARTTLSDMAPWRQVAVAEHETHTVIDQKPEAGMQLIYRVTPINIFGEGPSAVSAPIRTPVMFANLEGTGVDLTNTKNRSGSLVDHADGPAAISQLV